MNEFEEKYKELKSTVFFLNKILKINLYHIYHSRLLRLRKQTPIYHKRWIIKPMK